MSREPSPFSVFAAAAGQASAAAAKAEQTAQALADARREWPIPSSGAPVRLRISGGAAFIHVAEHNLTPTSARHLIAILCEIIGDPIHKPQPIPSSAGLRLEEIVDALETIDPKQWPLRYHDLLSQLRANLQCLVKPPTPTPQRPAKGHSNDA